MACVIAMMMYRGGFLKVLFESFPKVLEVSPMCSSSQVNSLHWNQYMAPPLLTTGSLSLGETSRFLMVLLPLKWVCIPYLPQIFLMLSQRPWVYGMTIWSLVLTSLVTGWVPAVPWSLAPLLTLSWRPGKSFLYLVQSPFGVFAIGKCFPEMLHFFFEKLRIATDSFGPMGESINDTIFSWEMMVPVPLQILVHLCRFLIYNNRQLPSVSGFTMVSKKGMAPSPMLFSTVNCIAGSTLLMCCGKFCLFSLTYWHHNLGVGAVLRAFCSKYPIY